MELDNSSATPQTQDNSPAESTSAPVDSTSQGPTLESLEAKISGDSSGKSDEGKPTSLASAPVVPPQPAYQPNFKFSVMKKEHEIPEQFRSLIKDADTEKEVREIFEKAYGIDHVKGERAKLQDDYRSYRSQTEPLLHIARTLDHHRQKGDMGSYFKTLGLSKQDVWKWAIEEAERENLPANQRAVYDQHQEAQERAYYLEQQLQEQQAQYEQFQVQHRQVELDQTLSQHNSVIQAFDQRNGENAFRTEVILRGQMYWHTKGIDVPAGQLVQEIMTKYGLNQPSSPQMPTQQMSAQVSQPVQTTQAPTKPPVVPVLPNTGSGTGSPAKKKVSSLADIEREYNSL